LICAQQELRTPPGESLLGPTWRPSCPQKAPSTSPWFPVFCPFLLTESSHPTDDPTRARDLLGTTYLLHQQYLSRWISRVMEGRGQKWQRICGCSGPVGLSGVGDGGIGKPMLEASVGSHVVPVSPACALLGVPGSQKFSAHGGLAHQACLKFEITTCLSEVSDRIMLPLQE
jgi:hypothetical protein